MTISQKSETAAKKTQKSVKVVKTGKGYKPSTSVKEETAEIVGTASKAPKSEKNRNSSARINR